MTTWTWMRHPVTGGVQRFADSAVPAWQSAGWEPCDEPEPDNHAIGPNHPLTSAPEPPPAPVDEPAGIDPAAPVATPKTTTRRGTATETEE